MERVAPTVGRRALLARRGLLIIVAVTLVTGVLAGLARLGVLVGWGPRYLVDHGPLLVLGGFGTVIALERAVALGRGWGLAAPALGAAGAVAMLAGFADGRWLTVAALVALVALNAAIVRRQPATFTWLMLLGTVVLAYGALRWARGAPPFQIVATWIAYFVLTIVAERLELSRLAPTPRWAARALLVLAVLLAAVAIAVADWPALSRALGPVLALIAVWQLRFDLARRLVRRAGLPAFAATGVLAGAAWLLATGVFLAAVVLPPAGPTYDAALHGVFIGYVLSMVFAHAPIILPAVARLDVRFTPALYAPLALLHLGLVARVAGDLGAWHGLRRSGAIGSALALALFAATAVATRWLARPAPATVARESRPT
ncbi:MAG: hypothetical protein JNK64_40685 [Myxococcales bacterium]|nr:hypothetical protein [Myxococcales bacterium]